MKAKILGLIGMISLAFSINAATATYPLSTTATPVVILTNISGKINSFVMANPSAAAITLKFYDGIYTSLTYTNAAYTNNVVGTSSVVTTYTNILGRTESRTNTVLTYTPTGVAAATITLSPIAQFTVPATSTLTFTPVSTLTFGT